jgi:hypothetical protein
MADVKLFAPQRRTDNPDGGGLATATEVVDGQVNNLFDDISRIDRVNGELALRKAFAIAATADTALYSDLHVTVAAAPQDPRVSTVLFQTGVWDDVRDGAKAAVERFLDASVPSRMIPYDRQLAGTRAIIVFQHPTQELPEIGQVYVLMNETLGTSEFFRIQDLTHRVETFIDPTDGSEYTLRVITITIGQPLSQQFDGTSPNRFVTASAGRSIIRKTMASDAARYKGIVRLAADAAIGDVSIKVESIFAQLVPASTSEVPVVDANPPGVVSLMPTAPDKVLFPPQFIANEANHYFPAALLPLSIDMGPGRAHDDGKRMIGTDGELHAAKDSDFAHGVMWIGVNHVGNVPTKAIPAVNVNASALSTGVPVNINNRGYVYVQTLNPIPAPGSTVISFRSQGRWYTLADDGSGALVGAVGVGSGLVNFQTGSVSVSLGALPDVGSAVIFNWGAPAHYDQRTGTIATDALKLKLILAQGTCAPGTFTATFTSGGTTRTVSSDSQGVLSGAGTGQVNHALGEVTMWPKYLPDPGTSVLVSYTGGTGEQETFTPTKSAGFCQIQLTSYPVTPRTLQLSYTGSATGYRYQFTRTRVMRDNGSGGLLDEQGNPVAGGVINYSTGLITFPPDFNAYVPEEVRDDFATVMPGRVVSTATGKYEPAVGPSKAWIVSVENAAKLVPWGDGTPVTVNYRTGTSEATSVVAEAHPVSVNGMTLDLVPGVGNTIVPNSVLFVLNTCPGWDPDSWFYDRNGVIYRDMNPDTGAGIASGTIDYATGLVKLTDWRPRSAAATISVGMALTLKGLLTQVAPVPLAMVYGRTPGSPLRPTTFYIQATRFRDSATISATADANGNISSTAMHGSIDINSGVFIVAFGAYVLDASLTADDKAEAWYNASAVDADGYIWRPDEVVPGSVKFNCVIEVALPLDPAIVKVNAVRLPPDGRVPVIRPGDTLVIADELPYTMPAPLSAGQVVTLPRSGLASVAIYDANGSAWMRPSSPPTSPPARSPWRRRWTCRDICSRWSRCTRSRIWRSAPTPRSPAKCLWARRSPTPTRPTIRRAAAPWSSATRRRATRRCSRRTRSPACGRTR